ncbi:hypothetical protein A2U01_0056179, partial [Trifolium medium]|nr:hypothetical protein [Trifolium medium]
IVCCALSLVCDMRINDVDTSFFLGRMCVGTIERLGVSTESSSRRVQVGLR